MSKDRGKGCDSKDEMKSVLLIRHGQSVFNHYLKYDKATILWIVSVFCHNRQHSSKKGWLGKGERGYFTLGLQKAKKCLPKIFCFGPTFYIS